MCKQHRDNFDIVILSTGYEPGELPLLHLAITYLIVSNLHLIIR